MVCIKLANLPALVYNPCDVDADYAFYRPFYTVIPKRLFFVLCLVADVATAYRINSFDYFYYTIFTPLDVSAISNAILAFSPSCLDAALPFIDPAYASAPDWPLAALLSLGPSSAHRPSLNGFWYQAMCMPEQFGPYIAAVVAACSRFLVAQDPRLLPVFVSRATLRNYLPFIVHGPFVSLYFALYIVFVYLCHLFSTYAIVNTNFLFWSVLVFLGLYIFDIRYVRVASRGK